ncbi:hypothetical protein PR048_024410 [Dryococelus australis]|uniref:Uncharacterized protein n=1 Tax=Dryococelus australis TaxID=614101 RepID=A0ABQ9GNM5_9NEOP|nr:hypothetical protein PR048_024410 [Dryococelus australis]
MRAKRVKYEAAPESKGEGNWRPPRKHPDQRHRPARFPHPKIRERPRRETNPVRLARQFTDVTRRVEFFGSIHKALINYASFKGGGADGKFEIHDELSAYVRSILYFIGCLVLSVVSGLRACVLGLCDSDMTVMERSIDRARKEVCKQKNGLPHRSYVQGAELACSVTAALRVHMALRRSPCHFIGEKSAVKFNTGPYNSSPSVPGVGALLEALMEENLHVTIICGEKRESSEDFLPREATRRLLCPLQIRMEWIKNFHMHVFAMVCELTTRMYRMYMTAVFAMVCKLTARMCRMYMTAVFAMVCKLTARMCRMYMTDVFAMVCKLTERVCRMYKTDVFAMVCKLTARVCRMYMTAVFAMVCKLTARMCRMYMTDVFAMVCKLTERVCRMYKTDVFAMVCKLTARVCRMYMTAVFAMVCKLTARMCRMYMTDVFAMVWTVRSRWMMSVAEQCLWWLQKLEADMLEAANAGEVAEAVRMEQKLEDEILESAVRVLVKDRGDSTKLRQDKKEIEQLVRRDKRAVQLLTGLLGSSSGGSSGVSTASLVQHPSTWQDARPTHHQLNYETLPNLTPELRKRLSRIIPVLRDACVCCELPTAAELRSAEWLEEEKVVKEGAPTCWASSVACQQDPAGNPGCERCGFSVIGQFQEKAGWYAVECGERSEVRGKAQPEGTTCLQLSLSRKGIKFRAHVRSTTFSRKLNSPATDNSNNTLIQLNEVPDNPRINYLKITTVGFAKMARVERCRRLVGNKWCKYISLAVSQHENGLSGPPVGTSYVFILRRSDVLGQLVACFPVKPRHKNIEARSCVRLGEMVA